MDNKKKGNEDRYKGKDAFSIQLRINEKGDSSKNVDIKPAVQPGDERSIEKTEKKFLEHAKKMPLAIDTNQDKKISVAEFAKFKKAMGEPVEKNLLEEKATLSTVEELQIFLKKEATKAFKRLKEVDKSNNNDGNFDRLELQEAKKPIHPFQIVEQNSKEKEKELS